MKIFCISGFDEGDYFFPTKTRAIAYAKQFGPGANLYIREMEIGGPLSLELLCRVASGRGFAITQKEIWHSPEAPEDTDA